MARRPAPGGGGAALLPRAVDAEERAGIRLRHRQQYPSKMYQRPLDAGQRLFDRSPHGDLRDLILRPFMQRDTVVVGPNDLLVTAWQRMKLVRRQPAAGDGRRPTSSASSTNPDMLLHVYGDEARFRDPVSAAMVGKLDQVDVRAPMESLPPVSDRGHVAIVMDGQRFSA